MNLTRPRATKQQGRTCDSEDKPKQITSLGSKVVDVGAVSLFLFVSLCLYLPLATHPRQHARQRTEVRTDVHFERHSKVALM